MPTDQELADYLNQEARYDALILDGDNGEIRRLLNEPGFGTVQRDTLSGAEIFDAVVLSEFNSLSSAAQDRIKFLMHLGEAIPVGPNSKAREWLLDAFGPSTTTRTNLVALVERQGSEAEVVWGAGTIITIDQIRRAL